MIGGMGFRRMYDFNLALIAKQGWRLLAAPHSLFAKVYKARYFSDSNFLDAGLGPNPSFIWSSIMKVLPLIRKSCIRTIGNGCNTRVFQDPWLLGRDDSFVSTIPEDINLDLKVVNLFVPGSRDWDTLKLQELFSADEINCIRAIPLSTRDVQDCWCWKLENRGQFSVKSAYRGLDGIQSDQYAQLARPLWRRLWKVKVPPKVKNLIWRLAAGCLPSNDALFYKKVGVNPNCPRCDGGRETVDHIFKDCPFSSDVWRNVGIVCSGINFVGWLEECLGRSDVLLKEKILGICWAIWKSRNEWVWKQKRLGAMEVANMFNFLYLHWQQAKEIRQYGEQNVAQNSAHKWQKPLRGVLKINCDAASFINLSSTSWSCVLRDEYGNFRGARRWQHQSLMETKIAEAMAVKEALSWCHYSNLTQVQIESDAQVVCLDINSNEQFLSGYGILIEECRNLVSSLDGLSVKHVRRSANCVAHCLARATDSMSDYHEWDCIPPSFLIPLLLLDSYD